MRNFKTDEKYTVADERRYASVKTRDCFHTSLLSYKAVDISLTGRLLA
jgi:hypothetical protein